MGSRIKLPAWKRWLSHLFELHIESAPSEVNPHLYVSLSRGRYQLCTKHAVYSYGDLYDNFRKTFEVINWQLLPANSHVLLLGVGLGSIPFILERIFNKKFSYTGVELDENVLYLANKYVLQGLSSRLTLCHADAFQYMEQNRETFDLVCMDVFLDDTTPDVFESNAFLNHLKRATGPGGVVLYNCLAQSSSDEVQTRTFLHDQFLPVFPDGGYLDVGGNWMLLSNSSICRSDR